MTSIADGQILVETLSKNVYVLPSEPSMAILLGRVLVLITCTEGLKLATVTKSALLIWYGSAALASCSGCCTDPELEKGMPDGYWGWVGGSGWAGVSPGMGTKVAASSLRTGDSAVSWTSLALHTQARCICKASEHVWTEQNITWQSEVWTRFA